jgi:type IV pilus biogenesis/stability protein PilW
MNNNSFDYVLPFKSHIKSQIKFRRLCLLVAAFTSVPLFFIGFAGCATSQNHKEEAELYLRLGTSFLEQQNYPQALRELLNAERIDPENELVQNNLGLVYFLRDKYDVAKQHLQLAIKLAPKYSDAHNNYGVLLIETGHYDEALSQLQFVVSDLTYGNPARAWINMGRAYFLKNDFNQAKKSLAQAIRFDRDNCAAHTLYGRSLLELKDFKAAARSLDDAIIICKPQKFEEAHYFSGLSHYKLGQASAAVARMEEVIKMNPEGAYAHKAESLIKLIK